ncbi:hypothetical protein IM660_12290 [Ruania alkalisoli]|uniref:Uncharacterized protein n=1 Tax=Ruania alkalisoli TaxID=2779775 RepID=A0A7M1SPG7_9MICO|nr:hypothetical protein [Ruania alkalisoli]QOR69466.1 hypothetical protein IM660_12290 [Ruania alkalisoli]
MVSRSLWSGVLVTAAALLGYMIGNQGNPPWHAVIAAPLVGLLAGVVEYVRQRRSRGQRDGSAVDRRT